MRSRWSWSRLRRIGQGRFRALAEECGLQTDVAAVFAGVQEFLEEVLAQRTER